MLETLNLCLHITRRNWLVYRKDIVANLAPTMVEPFFMLAAVGLGVGSYVTQVDGRSYVVFLAPGLAVSSALFTAFFETSYGFYVRLTFENIFRALLTTPVGPREVIIGEFIWVSLKGAAMATVLSAIMSSFGLVNTPSLLVLAPVMGFLVALPCGAIGLLATTYVRNINQFQSIYAFLISPLFFFSGIFFPIEQMPQPFQIAAKGLPLYHGVKLAQALFWNENPYSAFLIHGTILILFSGFFCTWAYRRIYQLLRSS